MCSCSPSLASTSMDATNLVASHLFSSLSCRAVSCVSVPSQCLEQASRRVRPREYFSAWSAVSRERPELLSQCETHGPRPQGLWQVSVSPCPPQ